MGNRVRREARYGAPTSTEAPIEAGRPKVGPADAATRGVALQKALTAREPAPTAPISKPAENPTKDLSLGTAAATVKNRGRQINRAVDDAS